MRERRLSNAECSPVRRGLHTLLIDDPEVAEIIRARFPDSDGGVEDMARLLAELCLQERDANVHAGVKACLESAAEGFDHAALDYYASWK